MAEIEVGKVTHFFSHLGVAALDLRAPLAVGDVIHIKGRTTDLTAKVDGMQVNHLDVHEAQAGMSVGIKVPEHVREHDIVYKMAA